MPETEADPSAMLRDDNKGSLRDDKGAMWDDKADAGPSTALRSARDDNLLVVTRSHLLTTMMTERPDSWA